MEEFNIGFLRAAVNVDFRIRYDQIDLIDVSRTEVMADV